MKKNQIEDPNFKKKGFWDTVSKIIDIRTAVRKTFEKDRQEGLTDKEGYNPMSVRQKHNFERYKKRLED